MRLLLIEDEHKIAQSLKKGLTQESHAVDLAYDKTTGLDLARWFLPFQHPGRCSFYNHNYHI